MVNHRKILYRGYNNQVTSININYNIDSQSEVGHLSGIFTFMQSAFF